MPDHVFLRSRFSSGKFGDQLLQVAHLLAQAFIVVGLEYPVGKPVIAHELPYVFDGVQLGRSWWQNINVMLDGISSLPVVCHPPMRS